MVSHGSLFRTVFFRGQEFVEVSLEGRVRVRVRVPEQQYNYVYYNGVYYNGVFSVFYAVK